MQASDQKGEGMAIRLDHARLIVLCERLSEATLAGHAEWRGEGEDHYIWERPEGAVAVDARDRDGEPPYQLTVLNPNQEKVEELTSALVDDDQPAAWNDPLAELYRVARRSALHADDIIEALIEALPKAGVIQQRAEAPLDPAAHGPS
jgi:hypothetical protein